ncbi:LAMI_0E16116g1_1 [Lachancea mirantina]|uniref:LAMI_0E16116g1_1 n=1 Tax=Lachancea mirantina TaxID=1230905 RepID=A0A1G4JSU5_9SACH|nr:LAMI_0E16116g1_1 [Lachancea mirantina]
MCGILWHHCANAFAGKETFLEFDEDSLARGIDTSIFDEHPVFKELVPYVAARGPNYASFTRFGDKSWFSAVLSLREPLTKQCIDVADRFILQYNGEIYNIGNYTNDTQYFAHLLSVTGNVVQALRELRGEFAFTVFDKETNCLYFGRDSVGKRSLSYRVTPGKELYVSSVSGSRDGFTNCEANAIYVYDTRTGNVRCDQTIRLSPYEVSRTSDSSMEYLSAATQDLFDVLSRATGLRIESIHPLHKENKPIGILFSGGLDCSVIAALICRHLSKRKCNTKVELLNVGFENPRTGLKPGEVPDRLLARQSTFKLRELFPNIEIILIEVDVSYEEFLNHRNAIIDLIYPKQTEMDLSIAAAFYFASRGRGFKRVEGGITVPYERSGIVLFSGLGADELYGGYHKLANKTEEQRCAELQSQIRNIHDRNLDRDDKIISSHGVEVRYPFLDEEVIEFSVRLPINYKVNKLILRNMASELLDMEDISTEPKRAIQFGAKSAKMTKDGNKLGTDMLRAID